jgi:signal transduction histidine kinase
MPVYNQWIENGLVASYVPSLGVILAAMVASMAAAILFARREAELARLRSDFVSNVSHEMRMPLAQILLSGETLQLGRTRSQAEYNGEADSIVREAHRLAGFVDNVLSFSRIEHNNVQVTPQPIDLYGVVDETIATARTLANGRAVTVTSTIARDVDAFVDPDALRQVLYNLLENAIKYGPVGQRIIVGAAPSTTVADRIEVWVDDEGPGVPVHATSAVFEPFVRLDRDRDAGIAGSGLGLAVVRFIIEQHGGRVRIEPGSRGRGTRFVIEIPATGPSC